MATAAEAPRWRLAFLQNRPLGISVLALLGVAVMYAKANEPAVRR